MAEKKVHISRFTPSRMAHKTLEAIFVQRQQIATDTLDRIRDSVLNRNMHYQLFIGPRGCGKTHFVSLIFHRIKAQADLDPKLRVAWLNEDKTSTSVLDLNRRIYESLSTDYPEEFPKDQLTALYDRKPSEAAPYIQKLLDERLVGKTALVIIENLDALFENLGRQGQHDWRGYLQESERFTLLATAQQLFPGVSDRDLPFYGFFQNTYMKPLTVQEGRQLLKNIATQQEDTELAGFLDSGQGRSRVRTLHHLSGGNHRVYVIFSEFINRKSLDELVAPFEKTLDELIPYYQERLRWLAPQQRMIVEHLCTCDRALPVKEIARSLFATNQTVSKQLKELKQKRYVRSAKRGRESLYELTEPLMRLAMELKESRGGPVRLIVDFLRVWYSREELQNRLQSLSDLAGAERLHVESAIEQLNIGTESLGVRALLMDIDELADEGPEQEILDAVQEIEAAAGKENHADVAAQVLKRLESRYPSLRVGSPLSAEGIPLELRFISPGPSWLQRPQGGLGLEKNPKEDKSPAPPPLGTQATAEMGYSEEALRNLALAGDYRFGSIMKTLPEVGPKLPEHPDALLDKLTLTHGVRNSLAFSIDEKHRLLAASPRMTQSQLDELLKGFARESKTYPNLSADSLLYLRILERHCARAWCETPWDGAISPEAQAWLDEHQDDELADLLHAADNPTGYNFSPDEALLIQLQVTDWYFTQGRAEQVYEWIERISVFITEAIDPDEKAQLLKTFGAKLRRWHRPELAVGVLTEAAALSPNHADIRSELGRALFAMSRYDEALEAHSMAVDLSPAEPAKHIDRANVLLELEHFHEALKQSDAAIELNPGYSPAWSARSSALRNLRRYDEAVSAIDKAIEIEQDEPWHWWLRGFTLDDARRFSEAVESYSKAIELDSTNSRYFNGRAVSLYKMGRFDEALESVTEALRLDPGNFNAAFTQVEILLASSQWEKGWAQARQCLKTYPPQRFPAQADEYFVEIVFNSCQEKQGWAPRIETLCDIYDSIDAMSYLGEGLVRSLRELTIRPLPERLLADWQNCWHEVGGQYETLSFSLRLFDAGIRYLVTREANSLLDLPVEQRAILEQLFGIEVMHDE